MNRHRVITAAALFLILGPGAAHAQKSAVLGALAAKIIESAPLESITTVKNAPFSAEAVTEFTQVLGDGNRIERHYSSTIARDSRGRTRRQEEIAIVGPLSNSGPAPTLVTIFDPDAGVTYTLDERQKIAFRSRAAAGKKPVAVQLAAKVAQLRTPPPAAAVVVPDPAASTVTTESLGTKPMEGGITAQGTRTTMTIPAGAVGNVMPIEVVSERWFSPELQMPVLITRRDPRVGETIYRLVSILRIEQPEALFTVPAGHHIQDGALQFRILQKKKF